MEFDKSRVYTALNADEVKLGSKVFAADDLDALRQKVVKENQCPSTLEVINPDDCTYRFVTDVSCYALCYLVSEPEDLLWTKLKIGDIIQNVSKGMIRMVTGINSFNTDGHIFAGGWIADDRLKDWEKAED